MSGEHHEALLIRAPSYSLGHADSMAIHVRNSR